MLRIRLNSQWKIKAKKKGMKEIDCRLCISFIKMMQIKNFTNQFFYSDLQMCWDKSLQFFGRWNETNSGLKIRKGWQLLRV
jgi:hypothetical protein